MPILGPFPLTTKGSGLTTGACPTTEKMTVPAGTLPVRMKPCFAFALIFFVALRLAAQDVIINGPAWVDPGNPPDQLPVIKTDPPDYPERLSGSTEIGYEVVDSFIFAEKKGFFAQGKCSIVQYIGTDPLFFEAINAAGKWRVESATRDGKPVNSIVRQTFIFNPACASAKEPEATPRLLSVVAPERPSGLAKNNDLPAKLYVVASIDATGQVTNAVADAGTPEIFGQLAEGAVRKWRFAPARKNGQPVAQDVRVPVVFLKPYSPDVQADTPPSAIYKEPVFYPPELRSAGMRGDVVVRFVVDIEGRVRNAYVFSSTNPAFNQPAINAILKWRFEPGRRDGVPVKVTLEVPLHFNLYNAPNGGTEAYSVFDNHVDQSKLPPELRYDIPPKPANVVLAVYPFELLRDRVDGTAEVRFLISPSGKVEQATVVKATRPEFGQALLAMLDEWKFKPAMKEGKPTQAVLDIPQEFSYSGGDVPVSDEAKDLLYELKKGKLDLCLIKDLDARPQLLSRLPPVFPSALIGKVDKGQAVVEFLIDQEGKVQLPRVVSATDPAFGYAAVQGAAAWTFAPLTSHGKSVAVRAQMPINFTTPKPVTAVGLTNGAQAFTVRAQAPINFTSPKPMSAASDTAMANGAQTFNVADLDQPPTPSFRVVPQYPAAMRINGITGTVKIGFICDTKGHVRDVHVISSSGSGDLDQAAVDSIFRWIFKPGIKGGHPVNVRMQVPLTFSLGD
jgi:TonB family protein